MSHKSNDASSSLLHPEFSSRRPIPQGSDNYSTSFFENEQPDDDCEPRRCITIYFLKKYLEVRESCLVNNNDADLSETASATTAGNERLRRRRIEYEVAFSHTQSNLVMLGYTLDQMLPSAYKRAYNGNTTFFATAFVSIVAYGSHFLPKFHLVELMCCVATGVRGSYHNLYWWAIRCCYEHVQMVQERLENGTLRQDHINYLEGGLWSFLSEANL